MENMKNDALEPDVNAETEKKQNVAKSVLSAMHDLSYLLAVVLVLLLLVFRIVVVSGSSMKDTLINGDYIFLLNNIFCGDYETGDVIVASKESFKDGEPIIKRVIATEGQTVTVEKASGKVYVDGKLLDEPYLNPQYIQNNFESVQEFVVEPGCLFVMGDNRNSSLDSRSERIGQIDTRQILGKAIMLFAPGKDPVTGERDLGRIGGID